MRPLPLAAASWTIAALLSAAPVIAEPASGWVDPPAKASESKDAETGAAKPAPAQAAGADAGKPAGQASATPTKQASATATKQADRPAPVAAARRSRLAARQERHREAHARRMTAFGGDRSAPVAQAEGEAGAQDPRVAGWAGTARRLAGAYLASISASNAATLAETPRFYAAQVRFYGRTMTTAALVAEKRRFVQRWPERSYAPQAGSMHTDCSAASATCTVRTVLGFRAESPERGVRSTGLSELVLTVSFADGHPVIVAESSRVLRRGAA